MRDNLHQEFWAVWNPLGHAPTHRHETAASALAEAERLARANRGQSFYVLHATDMVCVTDVIRVRLMPSDEIPF